MPPDGVSQATAKRGPRYFYGWNIVGVAFLSHFVYSQQFTSVLGLFMKPWQQEFGWSRSAIAAVQSVSRVAEAAVAPVIGPLVDRYGGRVLMPIGGVILSVVMLALIRLNSLWEFYLLRGVVVAIAFSFCGFIVTEVAINNWFVRKRGRAIAIAGSANHISNIVVMPLTVFVIATYGWRMMFVIFAALPLLFVIVPSIILMRRRPEDLGLHPDGIEPSAIETRSFPGETEETGQPVTETVAPEAVWSRREVLATSSFWLLSLAGSVDQLAFQGINISLAPYIQDLGYGQAVLASILTLRSALMAAAMLLMGFLAEYSNKPLVRAAPLVLQGVGALLFVRADEPFFLWLAAIVYALGSAGIGVVQGVVWANYFGRFSLGLVRSLTFLVSFAFGAAGPVAMSAVYDIIGSYRPAFIVISGLFVVAAILMWVVRPPQVRRYATAAEITPPGR